MLRDSNVSAKLSVTIIRINVFGAGKIVVSVALALASVWR
jgi:hypothetical protein